MYPIGEENFQGLNEFHLLELDRKISKTKEESTKYILCDIIFQKTYSGFLEFHQSENAIDFRKITDNYEVGILCHFCEFYLMPDKQKFGCSLDFFKKLGLNHDKLVKSGLMTESDYDALGQFFFLAKFGGMEDQIKIKRRGKFDDTSICEACFFNFATLSI